MLVGLNTIGQVAFYDFMRVNGSSLIISPKAFFPVTDARTSSFRSSI